jgi:hypothetical protein
MYQMPDGNEHCKPPKHANQSPGGHTKFEDAKRYVKKKKFQLRSCSNSSTAVLKWSCCLRTGRNRCP